MITLPILDNLLNIENDFHLYPNDKSNVVGLFAQPIENGFQIIDTTPKVILKIYTTSNPSCFIAYKDTIQGVLINIDNQWFFEYYDGDKLISESINLRF